MEIKIIPKSIFISIALITFINFVICLDFGHKKIIAGHATPIEKIPYQMTFLANGKFFCGAIVISYRFGLTAGEYANA